MKYINIITLVIVAGVLFIVYKLMQTSKLQTEILTSVGLKTGAIQPIEKQNNKLSKSKNNDDAEESEDPKKVKLNKVQKELLGLFEDGVPKTTTQLKQLFKTHYKEIDDVKLNNTIWNLKAIGVLLVEKIEKKNYWGPEEWFDDEELFLEEYADKIPGGKELPEKTKS